MKLIIHPWSRYLLKFLLALILAFIVFLLGMTVTDFRPPEKESLEFTLFRTPVPQERKEFTFMTWNLGYFGLGDEMDFFYDGGKGVRPSREKYYEYEKAGLDFIRKNDTLDFLLFQEVDRHSGRTYQQDQYQKLSNTLPNHGSAFGLNYEVFFVPQPLTQPMGKVKSGITLFSRFSPGECYRMALPGQYAWPVQLFMLDRCFILARYPLSGGKELVVINTHNEAFDKGDMRHQQLQYLSSVMLDEYRKGNYVVAGGDWNMNPPGYEKQDISEGYVPRSINPEPDPEAFPKGWKWVYDPDTPTNRDVDQPYVEGVTPVTIIDFFVHSPNVKSLEVHTLDLGFRWSDHNPVMMRCRLAD